MFDYAKEEIKSRKIYATYQEAITVAKQLGTVIVVPFRGGWVLL